MPGDVCPHCGDALDKNGGCHNPECPSAEGIQDKARVSGRGWGSAIILAIALAIISAFFLTLTDKKDEKADGIEDKLEKLASDESDVELIIDEGFSQAPPENIKPEPPGGLTWDELLYPEAERLLNYLGRPLKEDERAYVSHDSFDSVKVFYSNLIEERFFKPPGLSEVNDGDKIDLFLKNDTGSLTVRVTKYSWDEKVHILLTKFTNLADGRLKPYGGPPQDDNQ